MTLIQVPPDRAYHEVRRAFRFTVDVDMPPERIPAFLFPFLKRAIEQYERAYGAQFLDKRKISFRMSPVQADTDGWDGTAVSGGPERRWYGQGVMDVVAFVWFREPVLWLPAGAIEEERRLFREAHPVDLPEPLKKHVEGDSDGR